AQLRQRKAAVTRPEIALHYGEQLCPVIHLPPRHSDPLKALAERFFAPNGRWKGGDQYEGLIEAIETVPEQVTIFSDAMEFIERVLVVAPASVKYQWETEIRKFTDRPVQVIEGGSKARQGQYSQPTFYRLVNYEQVLRDLEPLNAWHPDLIVLDEAQRIKNWE